MDYTQYYLREAMWHLDRAKYILEEGQKDPEKFYRETQHSYSVMAPFTAMMMYASLCQSSKDDDTPTPDQNLSQTPPEDP